MNKPTSDNLSALIASHAANKFIKHAPTVCRGGALDTEKLGGPVELKNRIHHGVHNLVKHGTAVTTATGGFIPYFADNATGRHLKGGTYSGGGFGNVRVPQSRQQIYHMLLQMNPHQLEMFREIAAQLLGGRPSPMWGPIAGGSFGDKLEAPAEDYEHMIRMPNIHAAARMLEAENEMGGGFGKVIRHLGKIAHRVYKAGHHVVKWAGQNQDLLMNLVPDDYKQGASTALQAAQKWDNAISPMVDVASKAFKDNATSEDKAALRKLAAESVEGAVKKYKPELGKYIDSAKQIHSSVQNYRQGVHHQKQTEDT